MRPAALTKEAASPGVDNSLLQHSRDWKWVCFQLMRDFKLEGLPCPCKPEVTDFDTAGCIHQEVRGLQISVEHVGAVHVFEPAEHLQVEQWLAHGKL